MLTLSVFEIGKRHVDELQVLVREVSLDDLVKNLLVSLSKTFFFNVDFNGIQNIHFEERLVILVDRCVGIFWFKGVAEFNTLVDGQ